MNTLRTGVVGVGHLGQHHARIYAQTDGASLVGIVDRDGGRAQEIAERFDTVIFESPQALIEAGVDAVSIAVPTVAHRDAAMPFLESGVHVLVEKPITATAAEGRELVAAARHRGLVLQVGHSERFNGAVIALNGAITRPRFIECHRLSAYPNRGHDVSVVHDLMIHDLDIILTLVRAEIASIDAAGVAVFSPTEDIANVRIRFEDGCVANLTASRVSMEPMRKIRIFSDDAYTSTDYSERQVLVYRKIGEVSAERTPMECISIESLEVSKDEPLRLEIEAFLDSIRTGAEPAVPGEAGLAAVELAERIVAFIREHT